MELRSRSVPPPEERQRELSSTQDLADSHETERPVSQQTPNTFTSEIQVNPLSFRHRQRSPSPDKYRTNLTMPCVQAEGIRNRSNDFENDLNVGFDNTPPGHRQNPYNRTTQGQFIEDERNETLMNRSQMPHRWGNAQDPNPDRTFTYPRQAFREPHNMTNYRRYSPTGNMGGRFKGSPVKPVQPTFDGNSCSCESFLLQLRLLARTYKWSADEFHTQLILSMKGKALSYVTSLQPRAQENTDALLAALEKRFGRNKLAETQRATLSSLHKHLKESWQEYCARVDELMSEAYPGMQGTDIYSGLATEHFLRGISDRKLAYEVQLRKPRDLTEAVQMIMWHEACKQSSFRGTDIRKLEESTDTDYDSETEMSEMRRINHHRISRPKKSSDMRRVDDQATMEERLKKLLKDFEAVVGHSASSEDIREKSNRSDRTKERICYSCRQPGHISPDCPDNPKSRRKFSRDSSVNRKTENQENDNGLC